MGAVGDMRVFFSPEAYQYEPDLHPYDFVKTSSHQVEENVPTRELPHFWANQEADVHAKHGGLMARAPTSNILYYQCVVNEIKRAARFVAARLSQLPLHRDEPPSTNARL